MPENLIGKNPLSDSNYHIIEKIFDDEMLRKWIIKANFSN